jgi:DNA repair protein RadC
MIMESTNEKTLFEVAEIQLTYKSKIKASLRPKITSSRDAYEVLNKYWDEGKIDFVEYNSMLFKIIENGRSNPIATGISGTILTGEFILRTNIKYSLTDFVNLRFQGNLLINRPQRETE